MPEPHILLTVVQGVPTGMPAASAACRAGAWPRPADNTQPINTWPTSAASISDAAIALAIAAAPSAGAVVPASAPWNAPIGVRFAATITMGSELMTDLRLWLLSPTCRVRTDRARQGYREFVVGLFPLALCDL